MKGTLFSTEMPGGDVDLRGNGQELNPPAEVCLADLLTVLAILIMNHCKEPIYMRVFVSIAR